jgi:hypothetical protein
MKAGKDLDADVERKIFRNVVMYDESGDPKRRDSTGKWDVVPPYSTDTDSAYSVILHFQRLGYTSDIGSQMKNDCLVWTVKITKIKDALWGVWAVGTTLAHAVSAAGLALQARLTSET